MTLLGIWRGQILAEGKDVNQPHGGFMGDFEYDESEKMEENRTEERPNRSENTL